MPSFDIDVFLSQLMDWDKYVNPDTVQAFSRAAMQFAPAGPELVRAAEFLETGGGARPDLLAPTPGAELGGAAVEEKAEQDRLVQEQRVYDIKAASDKARQAQLDELGSLVTDMPSEKLFKIRAEAQQRSRQGSLEYGKPPSDEDYEQAAMRYGGGGGFTVAPDSPQIQQRQEDTAAWLADQPIRDAQFALTPEQADRRPRQAAMASDRLVGLQAAKIEERQVANQEALISAIGKGGKIPFDTAMKLQASGLSVPWPAMGSSPDKVRTDIEDALAKAQNDVARIINDPIAASMPGANETIKYFQYVIEVLPRYAEYLERGADPDEINRAFTEMLQRYAQDSGAFAFWDANFARQAAAPTEGQ